MTLLQSFILGIIQGLTEFLPVSSTAHLLIAQHLFGIAASELTFSFLVIVQLGTILSLLIYYGKDIWKIIRGVVASIPGLFRRERAEVGMDTRIGWYILIATLPAFIAGYFLKDAVEWLFRTPLLEAGIRLVTASILLLLAEILTRKARGLDSMTWLDALVIGLFQVIAVFPGASRSGTTIAAGMFRGLDRPSAARFAFLMSIPVMLGAGAYEMIDVVQMPGLLQFLPLIAVGFIGAALAGWLAIRWFITYLSRNSLIVFSIYCGGAGALCLASLWL